MNVVEAISHWFPTFNDMTDEEQENLVNTICDLGAQKAQEQDAQQRTHAIECLENIYDLLGYYHESLGFSVAKLKEMKADGQKSRWYARECLRDVEKQLSVVGRDVARYIKELRD